MTTFFGWGTQINLGIVLLFFLFVSLFHEWVGKFFAKLFGITPEEVKVTIFRVFQQFQIALVMLNGVPYIALLIMS